MAADAIAPSQGTAPRLDALLPGTRLEEFEVERVIGSSGFGLVYLANDESFERRVAIKEYLPDTLALRGEDGLRVLLRAASHADAFERGRRAFVEEAQLLARCSHPSLLHVLRQWEAHGTVYRAMPCYPGHSLLGLRQALQAPPDEPSLRGLLDGLLDALDVLHDAGALHREIAPARILLLPDDRPVLMGPSAERRAIVGDQARALMTLLTPSFAPLELTAPSPERPLGPWTDLYALAAVVKYCLGGELPPPTSLYGAPMREAMGALAQRVCSAHPHLHYSASFLAAIDAALAPRPQDRPQNVAEFRSLLDDHPPAWGERVEREDTAAGPAGGAHADSGDAEPSLGPFYSARPAAPPSRWKADAGAAGGAPPSAAHAQQAPASPPVRPAHVPPAARDAPSGPVTPAATATPVAAAAPEATAARQPLAAPPAEPLRPPPAALPPRREPRLEARPAFVPPPRAPAASMPPPRHAVPRLGERAMAADPALFAFVDRRRRARRRLAWFGGVLMLAATGAGIWVLDQQRSSTDAQTALAQAARQDGLTANVPTLPQVGETAPAAPAAPTADPAGTNALPQAPTAAIADPLGTPEPAAMPAAPTPHAQTPTSAAGTEAAAPGTPTPPPASVAEPVEEIETELAQPAAPAPRAPAARSGNDATARSAAAQPPRSPTAPTRLAADTPAARARVSSPREACGKRTQFALYRCMQTQCDKPQWTRHAQCKRLRIRDEVD